RLAVAVPTASEPRIAQIDMAKAGAILEVDGNKRHDGPRRLYPSAVVRSLCWRQRRRVCLVRKALGDLHEVAGRIAQPHGSPTRYKRIKTERSEHHVRIGTHGSELGVDVIHNEREIADAGPWIAVAFGWGDRRCGCRLEQFEVHLPIADEDNLAFAEGDHARPHEAEMAR